MYLGIGLLENSAGIYRAKSLTGGNLYTVHTTHHIFMNRYRTNASDNPLNTPEDGCGDLPAKP
jgi:hypothetical protein